MKHEYDRDLDEFARSHGLQLLSVFGSEGGNSRMVQIEFKGEEYLLKRYLGDEMRAKRSCLRERYALKALQNNGVGNVPRINEKLQTETINCIQLLRGTEPKPTQSAMDSIIQFQYRLIEVRDAMYLSKENPPLAIDAAFTEEEILVQIDERLRIGQTKNNKFWKIIDNSLTELKNWIFSEGENTIYRNCRVLSQSDIGCHNMIEVQKNEYFFVDFEFFGIDSPQKLIVDFLLHPKNKFETKLNARFVRDLSQAFCLEPENLNKWVKVLSLKWATIMLRRLEILGSSDSESFNIAQIQQLFEQYMVLAAPESRVTLDELMMRNT